MYDKTVHALAAAAGVLIVLALTLIGADLCRHARTGSKWKRRLVAAGLFVLAGAGLLPWSRASADERPAAPAAVAPGKARATLDASPRWQNIVRYWPGLVGLAETGRSSTAQRKRAHDQVKAGKTDASQLASEGLLTRAEADLLIAELETLHRRIESTPPIDGPVCYTMPAFVPAQESLHRLSKRVAALEKIAAAGTVRAEVLFRALGTIEADLAVLEQEKQLASLGEDRDKAVRARDEARAALAKIRAAARPKEAALKDTPQWKAVAEVWRQVKPLAETGKSTTAQRQQAEKVLAAAGAAAGELAVAGMLTAPEARLLRAEMDRLRKEMYRNPPTDTRIMCYQAVYILPAREGLTRIARRLPVLKRLAQSGRVTPAVVEKVLPAIRADLKLLADDKETAKLPADQRERAAQLRMQAEELLKQIEKLPEAAK